MLLCEEFESSSLKMHLNDWEDKNAVHEKNMSYLLQI